MRTFKQRSNSAKRAAATREARRSFRTSYPETAYIAEDILRGLDNEDIAWNHDVAISTVAAVKANLNRYGSYSCNAEDCNF